MLLYNCGKSKQVNICLDNDTAGSSIPTLKNCVNIELSISM